MNIKYFSPAIGFSACALMLTSCSTGLPAALHQLDGSTLEYQFNEGQIVSGPSNFLIKDGVVTQYYFNDQVFTDSRFFNGASWKNKYEIHSDASKVNIHQDLKWEQEGQEIHGALDVALTYLKRNSGLVSLNFKQLGSNNSPEMEFKNSGTFKTTAKKFQLMDRSLALDELNFNVRKISTNSANTNIAVGDDLQLWFDTDERGTIKHKGVDRQLTNCALTDVGVYSRSVKCMVDKDSSVTVNLNFEGYTDGQASISFNDGSFLADGIFYINKTTAIPAFTVKGVFKDGFHFASTHTGINYPYAVYLPPHYETSKKKYPVIYLTDGQWVKDYHRIIEMTRNDCIAVFIEQGGDGRRMKDYKGEGTLNYAKFLKEELIPHIENEYRTNQTRYYFGASLGGTIGAVLLGQETAPKPYFSRYILSDGAFWANSPNETQAVFNALKIEKDLPIDVYLSGSRQGNYLVNLNFYDQLVALKSKNVRIENLELPVTHTEMAPPTFTYYLKKWNK